MPTLIEALLGLGCITCVIYIAIMPAFKFDTNKSYGVEDNAGEMFFVEAHSLTVDVDGRLIFWRGFPRRIYSIVERGEWKRVLEGLTLEDFKNGDTG